MWREHPGGGYKIPVNIIAMFLLTAVLALTTVVSAEDVSMGPVFVKEPPNRVDFSNGTGAVVECQARGNPQPDIIWVRSDGTAVGDVPGLRQVLPNGNLVFPPFRAEDYRQEVHAQVYSCLARSPAGSVHSRDVNVRAVFSNKLSMRLAILSIYVSSLVITSAYSASLISFLTLTKIHLPFSTLEGYVKDGSYKLIVMNNSAEYNMVKHFKTPMFLKMYELLEEKKQLPSTLSDGFKQICERKKLAFYTTEVFKSALNINQTCKIIYIESGRTDNIAMALTKGNPYIGLMNYNLRRFQLNGLINKLKGKYLLKSIPLETDYNVVSLKDIAPTLTIVAGSIVLALFILIIEKMHHSLNTRFKSNESKNQVTFLMQNYKSEAVRRI